MAGGIASLSARRAWIEIGRTSTTAKRFRVALRKESVDRNKGPEELAQFWSVALRKESVDRNMREDVSYNIKETSLSARRAWIEIMNSDYYGRLCYEVALRKESVDRNRSIP